MASLKVKGLLDTRRQFWGDAIGFGEVVHPERVRVAIDAASRAKKAARSADGHDMGEEGECFIPSVESPWPLGAIL